MNRKWEMGNRKFINGKSEIPGTLKPWNTGTLKPFYPDLLTLIP